MKFLSRFAPLLLTVILLVIANSAWGQEDKLKPGDKERALAMLSDVAGSIRGNYYDPKFNGHDLQAAYTETKARIEKATSFNQMLGLIGWFVDSLDDSHTFFIPPPRAYNLEYGWRAQMIGDQCYVTKVKPGSDAEKQGLKPGDQVAAIMGVQPTRDILHKLMLLLNALRPQPVIRMAVLSQNGEQRTLDIQAAIKPTRHEINSYSDIMDEIRKGERYSELYDRKSAEVEGNIVVWKLYDFDMFEKGADAVIDKARKGKALILDLRGNPGGSVHAVDRMIADFFEHDVKVAEPRGRKKFPDVKSVAKGRGDKAYSGKLLVLVDSNSASASEILARVVQLEGRGTIIGDRSAGAVMMSEQQGAWHGVVDTQVFYGTSITVADLTMKDGASLEKVGVTPDVSLLPTAEDLAAGRDPALAKAVELAGGKITPEEAGKLFPFKWPPQ